MIVIIVSDNKVKIIKIIMQITADTHQPGETRHSCSSERSTHTNAVNTCCRQSKRDDGAASTDKASSTPSGGGGHGG